MTERVAIVEDEARYIPPGVLAAAAALGLDRIEIVWFVDDAEPGGLVRAELIDTERSLWAPVAIVKVDPDDPTTWTMAALTDWQPIKEES